MRYAGKPLFEETFPPELDTVTGNYTKIPAHRIVFITEKYEAKLGVPVEGLQYGITTEGDGANHASPMMTLVNGGAYGAGDSAPNNGGSNREMTVRMAGTCYVASAAAMVRGDYFTSDANGRAIKASNPKKALGQLKEDAAIGSLVFVRINGMSGAPSQV